MRAIALICLSSALLVAQQQTPTRDSATRVQRRVGTGVIRGRVIAGDTGAPIRRAQVIVYGERQPPAGGTVMTDAMGRFALDKLPPDTYRISIRPSRYQTRYLGRPLPGGGAAGAVVVTLADGQVLETTPIALPRAGAIVGRVVDESGDPVSNMSVTIERARRTSDMASWSSVISDDLGRFRIFNLAPGDYYVVTGSAETDDQVPGVQPAAFLPTYAPGTTSRAEATVVRVESGKDIAIDIQLTRGRTFRITGTLLDSEGRPVASGQVALLEYDKSGHSMRSSGAFLDAQSRFTIPAKPPGEYRISGKLLDDSGQISEFVKVPITIVDSDIAGLVLTTKPAVSVKGQVVFAEGVPVNVPPLRISPMAADRTLALDGITEQARVGNDLSFTIRHLFGEVLIRPTGLPNGWFLKGVMLGSEDITDTAREFTAGDSGRVQLILSSRMSTIEGRVDAGSASLQGNIVLLFGEDRQTWRSSFSRFAYSFTDREGRFKLVGLRPGRYFIVALPRDQAEGYRDAGPDFFEPLVREASSVLVGEDEARSVDLKLATGGQ